MSPYPRQLPQSYSYSPRPLPKPARRRPHRGRKFLLFLVIALLIGVAIDALAHHDKTAAPGFTGSITAASSNPKPSANLISTARLSTMGTTINGIITTKSNIDMSVSLIDLNSGQAEHYGDSGAFTAASTTKVITAADFLHQAENGKESLNETINGNTAEYEIQQMIVISDDDAWDALNNELGYDQLEDYAASIGASSFQPAPNTVTSGDMALILQKLWNGQLLDQSNTQLLLGYMKQANYRQYIVPAVPASDTIYHKVGLYEDNVHDEAIITSGSKAFVIVIFTNGNGVYNWSARAQIMQQITQAALTAYFGQS